ncbi:MAG: NADH:flavin oxidoreductase/NADH oxidase [Propionibacteriaceae bacterium]
MLFEPLTLRGLTIRNRIWLSPMCTYSARNGVPNDWHLMHYGARAAGGFGLLIAEATGILPEGRITSACLGLWNDEQTAGFKRIVDFCHSQGAAFGVQLQHAGRKAGSNPPFEDDSDQGIEGGGWSTIAPSACAFEGMATPAELSVAQIGELVAAFAASAQRAVAAGMDFVEIHGAHGYLVHQFYSPLSNHRTDSYGGIFENRVRFLLEVVDAVRNVIPETMPLFVRISATDWSSEGWTLEDSVRLAPLLTARGVDVVDTSTGGNQIVPIPLEPGYQVPHAAAIRAAGITTSAVGLITEPAYAESILQAQKADAICLGRVALREPTWPLRAAHELGLAPKQAPYPPQWASGAW